MSRPTDIASRQAQGRPGDGGSTRGRRRDPSLDGAILDATLVILAEHGYDGMTIDLVAARIGSARATVYRRWPTKAELVLAAVDRLSRADTDHGELPHTGSLRGDLVAMILPLDDEQQQLRIRAMAALLSLPRDEPRLAEAAKLAGIGPWIATIHALITRAVDRGEFPAPPDLHALAEVIPMLCVARAVQRQPITRDFSLAQIDGVLLPALRGGGGA